MTSIAPRVIDGRLVVTADMSYHIVRAGHVTRRQTILLAGHASGDPLKQTGRIDTSPQFVPHPYTRGALY
jgi:hypothetical protein